MYETIAPEARASLRESRTEISHASPMRARGEICADLALAPARQRKLFHIEFMREFCPAVN